MARLIDLTGQRFGRLVVQRRAPSTGANARWICRCDCGAETTVRSPLLTGGITSSCGCLHKELVAARLTTHGQAAHKTMSPTYRSWRAMRSRCLSPNASSYDRYGGRGITICERWSRFEAFLEDMGERPVGMTLDRIDGDRGYGPDNCRWATPHEQRLNQRRSVMPERSTTTGRFVRA